jgi:cytochrome c-type biogenesis protein CcsB
MSGLSDLLLEITILGYALAMLSYAAEYAFGSRGVVARIATGERILVGAGGPSTVDRSTVEPPPVAEPRPLENRAVAAAAGRIAIGLTVAAWLAHIGCIVTRGLAAHRVPWGNMYEFVLAACLVGATAWLVLLRRRPMVRPLGLFVSLVLVLLLGTDALRLYTKVGPLMPALNSYWLKIHVTAAITASGILLVGFVAAALTLIRTGYEAGKDRFPYTLGDRLPASDGLERLTFRVHAFAFPIWTFAIICGAIWAEAAWGRYWGWDPKETWSFVAWVLYAGYLHARATPSVKRTVATWIAVIGWVAMMVNLFGVNLVISGLHSYAGVK